MEERGPLDSTERIGESLAVVARGSLLLLLGILCSYLFGFFRQFVVIRMLTPDDFGLISLGVIVIEVLIMMATLGLNTGSQRCIAYFWGSGEEEKVQGVVRSTLTISSVSVLITMLCLVLLSSPLSSFFDMKEIKTVLVWLSPMIPAYVAIDILTSFFLGFQRAWPKAFFHRFMLGIVSFVFVVLMLSLRRDIDSVLLAMSISYILVAVAVVVFSAKRFPITLKGKPDGKVTRILMRLSLPLLASSTLNYLIFQTDTILIGHYLTRDQVGIYNSGFILSQLLASLLNAVAFIYMPVITSMQARGAEEDIKEIYRSITKWLFIITFPLFALVLLFPREILGIFFGSSYTEAGNALRFLALGELVNVLFGPVGMTLVAKGRTDMLMAGSVVGVSANIALNIVLIPRFGIEGAAVASCISLVLLNLTAAGFLFFRFRLQPFHRYYLLPASLSAAAIAAIYPLLRVAVQGAEWTLFIFIPPLVVAGVGMLYATRSIRAWEGYLFKTLKKALFSRRKKRNELG